MGLGLSILYTKALLSHFLYSDFLIIHKGSSFETSKHKEE